MTSETGTERRTPALPPEVRAALAAQLTGRTNRLFYFVVLAVALVGSSTAARDWLIADGTAPKTWHLWAALVAVAVYELGAVAVSRFADQRRQLGERALIARVASAALAGGAIAAQYLGHQPDTGPAVFFAGVSATGYVTYLLEAAANRRDALRREGKLADTPPAYGPWQWVFHFPTTRRARALALARAEARLLDKTLPPLGRVASLEAATEQARAQRRLAAIEDALRTRIAAGVDETMATVAVNTYDMARVAGGIAAAADYPALTRIITAELVPARLVKLGDDPAPVETEDQPTETAPVSQPTEAETVPVPAAETEQPRPVLDLVPAGVRLLTLVPLNPPPVVSETEPVPAVDSAETEQPPADDEPADQGETGDVLAGVEDKLLPLMLKVIDSRADWAVAVLMPPRHPDALNVKAIMAAAGTGSKAYGVAIGRHLRDLAPNPETVEAALRSRGLTTAAAS